ncbi:MAG: DNA alkylation repair protein [Candidatus Thioglobus sp.]|mgnify:FL=1|jgi:3-methyladenine DNA glycosylase AlkD|nr:DNA alkylation repair protein [Candidatus Thioglobus sp.]|tara:strand:- start:297 stop:1004 length:708 start_codon:yes stop_codon:yes gene_type:complete
MIAKEVINELKILATEDRRKSNEWFFKTNKGEYGYGDIFLGVRMPDIRKVAKKFSPKITLKELTELIQSPIHEVRLCALIILVNQYKKGNFSKIFEYYIRQINFINNWDLVDSSAPYIVGDYLYNNPDERSILFEFVHSENLWVRRISIVSTFTLIKNNQFNETLQIAKILLNDKHDLIHKAVGWMLREVYKRDQDLIRTFLKQNYAQLPRTTLRYAIERMDEVERLLFLKGYFP